MQKKEKNTQAQGNEAGGFKSKSDAIERLMNADKKVYSSSGADPGRKYRSKGFLDKIPSPIKALFIKFWFNGAVCFFIFWGLGMYIPAMLDMIVIFGVVLGMVTDVLVNNTFHFFAITPGSNNKWMMFPKRKFWTFFANIIYAIVVLAIVVHLYTALNLLFNTINGTVDQLYLGVEPVAFGLLYVAVDMVLIGMKNLMIKIISDAREKTNEK